uniref:Venom S1 protease 9 n=1 Tax=Oncocephalus sp. TaxID=2944721 RepID=A0AB38ZEG9_9HEMI
MKVYLTVIGVLLLYCGRLSWANSDEDEDSSEYGVVKGEFGTNCTCGTSNKDGERIIGGEEAKKNEWPMIAELNIGGEHLCGGTVVTRRHVVTAAHCAFMSRTLDRIPIEMIDVYVGIHEVRGVEAFNGGDFFGIEEFITHPKYHYIGKEYDIAVIFLDMEIDFSPNIMPACLPLGDEIIVGDNLKVLGWGTTEYQAELGAQVLMKVNIRAVEHKTCQTDYEYYNVKTNICMYTKDKDACQGDSGGPLLWRDPETNRYVLVAATSYGKKCGILPAVNANVIYFLPFIQETIAKTDPTQKTCAKQK